MLMHSERFFRFSHYACVTHWITSFQQTTAENSLILNLIETNDFIVVDVRFGNWEISLSFVEIHLIARHYLKKGIREVVRKSSEDFPNPL